jgi:hypothetical protein
MPRKALHGLLLLLPFIALLWVGLFNRAQPAFLGIPFFYVSMCLWILLTALMNWVVHRGRHA